MHRLAAALIVLCGSLVLAAPAESAGSWTWPLRGEVMTPYRNGSDPYAAGQHRGIDIAGAVGAPVVAAAGGTVRFAGTAGNSGLTVSVRTADGRFDMSYLHLSTVAVRAGQRIAAGDSLGAVGTTGRRSAAAPHLHFGVRDAGSRTAYHDPLDFLLPPPVPRRDPVPPGTPVPVGAPARPAPAPLGRPLPRPAPAGRRVPIRSPRRVPVPVAHRAPRLVPPRVPHLAPIPVPWPRPRAAPKPVLPAAPRFRKERAPAIERARPGPSPETSREPARGPDLGLVLACVGLLAAAAVIGLRPDAGPNRRERPSLMAIRGSAGRSG